MSFSNIRKYFSFLLLTEFHSHYVVNKFYPQTKSFFLYELSVNDKNSYFHKKINPCHWFKEFTILFGRIKGGWTIAKPRSLGKWRLVNYTDTKVETEVMGIWFLIFKKWFTFLRQDLCSLTKSLARVFHLPILLSPWCSKYEFSGCKEQVSMSKLFSTNTFKLCSSIMLALYGDIQSLQREYNTSMIFSSQNWILKNILHLLGWEISPWINAFLVKICVYQ